MRLSSFFRDVSFSLMSLLRFATTRGRSPFISCRSSSPKSTCCKAYNNRNRFSNASPLLLVMNWIGTLIRDENRNSFFALRGVPSKMLRYCRENHLLRFPVTRVDKSHPSVCFLKCMVLDIGGDRKSTRLNSSHQIIS